MTHTVHAPADRPEVEVLVDGAWVYGELRMWTQLATARGGRMACGPVRMRRPGSTRSRPSTCGRLPAPVRVYARVQRVARPTWMACQAALCLIPATPSRSTD